MEKIIQPSSEASSLLSSKSILKQLRIYIEELQEAKNTEFLSQVIVRKFISFQDFFIRIANGIHEVNKENDHLDSNEIYLLHSKFPNILKDVSILHRDTFLQLQIAQYKLTENIVKKETVISHFEKCKITLLNALFELIDTIEKEYNTIEKTKSDKVNSFSEFKHYKNPWLNYLEQLELLKKQIKEIILSEKTVIRTIKSFRNIREYNITTGKNIIAYSSLLQKGSAAIIDQLKKANTSETLLSMLQLVDNEILKLKKDINEKETFTANLDFKTNTLTKINLPVKVREGLMITREIAFDKVVQKWLDYEVLPVLMDLWDHKLQASSFFEVSIQNLKSSLILIKNNGQFENIPSQLEMFKNIHKSLSDTLEKQKKIVSNLEAKLNKDFFVTHAYKNRGFLEVSIQSSLSHLSQNNVSFFTEKKNKLKKWIKVLNGSYESKLAITTHKSIEVSTQCIAHRMFKEENASYDTLFLNKNFIGNLFIIERTEEEKKIENILMQWRNGFNKSVLITGHHLSGKSTFLEYASKKYFGKEVVFLEPETEVIVEGRKFRTTRDLKHALFQIKKEIYHSDPIIIIDNLESWRDKKTPLLHNIRGLIQFIESDSDEALVIAVVTSHMLKHLDTRISFSDSFSNMIDLSKAKSQEIMKALALRHGASHKKLVNIKNINISIEKIKKIVNNLSKTFDYNIGEVLQAWAYSSTVKDKNIVLYNEAKLPFSDFFSHEEAIILKYTLVYKSIDELELKSFVGSQYESHYKSAMKRLINTKILLRDNVGDLKINPIILFDIQQILTYRGILK